MGFDPAQAATFGFAILSDIEAFFLISAAQGDNRSNVLQAPKVTLFNGQLAIVSRHHAAAVRDGVIPVVGDFAAAQQPVIVVLDRRHVADRAGRGLQRPAVRAADGGAVLQPDRRRGYVHLHRHEDDRSRQLVGFEDQGDRRRRRARSDTSIDEGTTVQLPTFSFVTVTTTVSVPDGGTVLLGGIKRLSEGRNERGVPILSKLPYINRLFKNVGIGRTTQSLMMMVTPRIIIQEEEEENLLGTAPP